MKDIVIIANFCPQCDTTLRGRFFYLAELLTEKDYRVEIVTSDFNHRTKQPKDMLPEVVRAKITYVHEPGYPDNISLKRLYSHWVWGRNVEAYLRKRSVPDCIYCAIPSLTAALKAGSYARQHKVPFIIDIQDLWPEAFQLALKSQVLKGILYPLKLYANAIYRKADAVVAVSETYRDRGLEVNRQAKGLCVFLGNEKDIFDRGREKYRIARTDNDLWLGYVGTLGYSYDLRCVMDAMNIIQKDDALPHVKLVIMGSGPLKAQFEEHARELGVNAVFTGNLPYEEMTGMLASCDMVVNPIIKGAAQSITNKVGDYALSGLPVINTQECEEYRKLIDTYQCGINCEPGSAEEIAEAIKRLSSDEHLALEMGRAHRRLGEERFDRKRTYPAIVELIASCR